MESELEKFHERLDKTGANLKLILDFESSNLEPVKNQMEIDGIKYKTVKNNKSETVDLRKRPKNNNSLF
jgi:hypothetical protein